MHLPGQADTPHRRERGGVSLAQAIHGRFRGTPPRHRVLLGPQGVWTLHVERNADPVDRNLVVVNQQRLERGGPEVDAEIHARAMRARNAVRVQDGAWRGHPHP